MIKYLLSCFFVLVTMLVQAQEPYHYFVDEHEGVPSNDVYDILQDKKGYIWLATDKGLARYDGNKARVFELPEARGIAITNLIEDSRGRIWFINFAGQVFYAENEEVKLFKEFQPFYKSKFPFFTILNDDLWLIDTHSDTLYQYSLNTNKWKFHKPVYHSNTSAEVFLKIKSDLQGQIWIAGNGMNVYKFINGRFALQNPFSLHSDINSNNPDWRLQYISVDQSKPNNELQQMAKGAVYVQSGNKIKLHPFQERFGILNKLSHYHFNEKDRLFLSTPNGLWVYTAKDRKCYFKNAQTTRIIKDMEGNYLIGTLGKGMIVIPALDNLLYNEHNSFLKTDKINKLHFFDGQIAISDNIGYATLFDFPNNKVVQSRNKDNDDPSFATYYNKKYQLVLYGNVLNAMSVKGKISVIEKLFTSRKDYCNLGNGYVASAGSTAICIMFIPGLIDNSKKPDTNTQQGKLFKAFQKSQLWYSAFPEVDWNTYALNELRCKSVAYHKKDNILYAAEANGLWYFNTSERGKILMPDGKDVIAHKLLYDSLTHRVFVEVFMKGIYEIKDKKIQPLIDVSIGLSDNYINSFAIEANKLILTHRLGMQLFDIEGKPKLIRDYSHFLFSKDVKDIWLGYGRAFIATTQGLQVMPLNISSTKYQPPVYIEQLQVNNKTIDFKKSPDESKFSYTDNNLEFALSGIAFSSKDQSTFLYRLIGLHNSFRRLSNSNVIRYNLLPSGKYRFEVLAMMPDGTTSKQKAFYEFEIKPPFYQTWWFYSLSVLMFTSITVWLVYWFLQRKHQKAIQLQEKQRLTLEKLHAEQEMELSKLTALKAQLNPHFLFNVLNSIQNTIYTGDKKEAFENLGKFSNMTRKILEYSNESFITLEKELEVLKIYLELEKLRYKEKLHFSIVLDEDVPDYVLIPSMLLQPFVENAIKHGVHHLSEKGLVEIHISYLSETHFKVEITDNGIGRKQSAALNDLNKNKPASFASKAIEERILFYNKSGDHKIKLTYVDLAVGTRIVLEIPYYE